MKPMNWETAISTIINHDLERIDDARHTIYLEVSCILDNTGVIYDDESLAQWLDNGDYDGTETPESIADEWNVISE